MFACGLEVEAKRKLQISLATPDAASLCQHFAEGVEVGGIEPDIGGAIATAAAAPVGVVNEVEGLGA